MMKTLFAVVALFIAHVLSASPQTEDLLVYGESLPDIMNGYDNRLEPVLRMDKTPHPRVEGITLTPSDKSIYRQPEATMTYDVPGYGSLLIHVIDDPEVYTPATRLGQEHVMSSPQPQIPGYVAPTTKKIAITPRTGSGPIDGYFTDGPDTHPQLILIVGGKAGADRFTILFTWIGVGSGGAVDEESIVAEWLPRAAAMIDAAKLQSLK